MTKARAIILIHGLRGTHDGLTGIAKNLKKAGYTVFTPDLPGSGTAPALKKATLKNYASWLNGYIKSLKLNEKPYLIGHSMGSIIVSHFIKYYPRSADHTIILLAPIFRSRPAQLLSSTLFAICFVFLHLLPTPLRFRFLKSRFVSFCISHYLTVDKSKQAIIDALHYRYSGRFASASSLLADMCISMNNQVTLSNDRRYLLILGNKDRLTPIRTVKKHGKHYSDLNLIILKNTGHLLNYERPTAVASAILKFLEKSQ